MIIPEKNRKEICKYLFQDGVCYAKKDYNLAKHPKIDVPNLQVIKLVQSFESKEYVRETFAWVHYYWYLTNDGIEFLRTYLNLPSEIVPATLKKQAKPVGRPMGGPLGDRLLGALRASMETILDSVIGRAIMVIPEGATLVVTKEEPLLISTHPSG